MSDDDQLESAPGPAAKDQPAEGGRDIEQGETSVDDIAEERAASEVAVPNDDR